MRGILVERPGGPEVLVPTELPEPAPGPGQLLIEVTAAGVNYADTHRTDGSYRGKPQFPFVPGTEVVGRTPDGRRVLGLTFAGGGYAERAVIDEADAVDLPDKVDDATALALLVQGLTAWHVLRSSARLRPGETVLIGAASGGVGSVAVQLARHFGAGLIIAAASTPEKRQHALTLGAHVAISNDPVGYATRVREAITAHRSAAHGSAAHGSAAHGSAADVSAADWSAGQLLAQPGTAPLKPGVAAADRPRTLRTAAVDALGADVVLDSTGGAALTASIEALAPFGRLVTYGNASREGRPPIDVDVLSNRNLSVAGYWLRPALELPGFFREPLTEMFNLVMAGELTLPPGPAHPLAEARQAHQDLLARRTTGKVVLLP